MGSDAALAWVQVGATVVLAIITGFYAWRTQRLAQDTARAAKAAVRSAESSEVLARLDSMPVAYAFLGYRSLEPDDDGMHSIIWQWRNLSERPAIALTLAIVTASGVALPSVGDDSILSGKGEGESATTLDGVLFRKLEETKKLTLTLSYQDAIGNRYATVTTQSGGGGPVFGLQTFRHGDGGLEPLAGRLPEFEVLDEPSKHYPPHGREG